MVISFLKDSKLGKWLWVELQPHVDRRNHPLDLSQGPAGDHCGEIAGY
jgi:hypothetical protein